MSPFLTKNYSMDYFLVKFSVGLKDRPALGLVWDLRLVKAPSFEDAVEHVRENLEPEKWANDFQDLTILPQLYNGL